MILMTTLLLIILVVGGAGWFLYRDFGAGHRAEIASEPETLRIAKNDLQVDRLVRIEIVRDAERIAFLHGTGWSLDGNWPARMPEVQQVVDIISGLASRFEPIVGAGQLDFSAYGLTREQHPVQVIVTVRGADKKEQTHTLLFGEPASDPTSNPFTKPTYLRLDQQVEVIRLAPG